MTLRTTMPATVPIETTVEPTAPRLTPLPATRRFRDALGAGAGVLLDGVESAAGFLPGGAAVTAAIRGAGAGGVAGTGSALSSGTGSGGPGAGAGSSPESAQSILSQTADQSMQYLELQEQISAENRRYTALSNVLKARHDTAKNAINNIR